MRATILLGLSFLLLPRVAGAEPYTEGLAARERKDWTSCTTLLVSSAEPPAWPSIRAARLQAAAGCAAQAGSADEAFRLLGMATEGGLLLTGRVAADTWLAPLRTDPRWESTLAASRTAEAAFRKTIGDPALRVELLDMRDEDVATRHRIFAGRVGPAEAAELAAMSARHVARLRQVLDNGRFPGIALVGKDGEQSAFLLAQHADEDRPFQKRYLELLTAAVKAGDAAPVSVAYLTDRLAVAEDRRQVYGTQFGEGEPEPIEDEAHVDERRLAVGLPPLAEYVKEMQEKYGTPDQIRSKRARWFVETYLARWDEKRKDGVVAMTAPDGDGVFITAGSPRVWVGFPTMVPAIEEELRTFDIRKSTVRDLRVQLLAGRRVAVATFLLDTAGTREGKPFSTSGMRMTWVLEDRDGRWYLVSSHGSLPVATAPPP